MPPAQSPQKQPLLGGTPPKPQLTPESAGMIAGRPPLAEGGAMTPPAGGGQAVTSAARVPLPTRQGDAPPLAVTEIFPASGGDKRMAVVNGLPVMDGTMVADAVVEEIRADRVMFLIQGKIVTVPLSNKR